MTNESICIKIANYDGVLKSSLYGLKEMFELASHICEELKIQKQFDVEIIEAESF